MDLRPNKSRTVLVGLILALATFALFGPVIYCDFVNYVKGSVLNIDTISRD